MKTIINPGVPEEAQYHCDVTGVPLQNGACVTITIRCGYGAPHDGSVFQLDLSEQAAETVLSLIRVLLLDGAPLEPHRTEVLLNEGPLEEKRITRRERAELVRRLEKLCRYKKRTLASMKKGMAESSRGKIR